MSADLRSLLFCSRLLACTLTLDWVPRDTLPSQRHPDEHPPRRDMLLAHVRVQPWQSSLLPLAANDPVLAGGPSRTSLSCIPSSVRVLFR